MLYFIIWCVFMNKKMNRDAFMIVIGGDPDADDLELLSGKPIEETNQTRNMLYLNSVEQLIRLLSPKKIDLLRFLMKPYPVTCPDSVSGIASKLHRKQEAVSRDLKQLKKLGLVKTTKNKQKIQASVSFKRIEIRIE